MGYTKATPYFDLHFAVHPHTRGVYCHQVHSVGGGFGSSPHTWGILNTGLWAKRCRLGSSPHTWGILYIEGRKLLLYRFIPTHVGYTRCRPNRRTGQPVHPHTRGVYLSIRIQAGIVCGSSPHTWGIPIRRRSQIQHHRFIPTHVGYTSPPAFFREIVPVHPHTRGVYAPQGDYELHLSGSSPHTWGIRLGITFCSTD